MRASSPPLAFWLDRLRWAPGEVRQVDDPLGQAPALDADTSRGQGFGPLQPRVEAQLRRAVAHGDAHRFRAAAAGGDEDTERRAETKEMAGEGFDMMDLEPVP